MYVEGVVVLVTVTVKAPHNYFVAEPETLSNQRGVGEKAGTRTEVVNVGCAIAVIVAVQQGLTYSYFTVLLLLVQVDYPVNLAFNVIA